MLRIHSKYLFEQPERVHRLDDFGERDKPVEAPVFLRCIVVQETRFIEQLDHRQVVPLADFEIVEIMGGRDLDRTAALFRIAVLVGDNRYGAIGQRQNNILADQRGVALVLGMDRHGGIAQHRLRPGRRYRDILTLCALNRVFEIPERSREFPLFDLEIRNRRVKLGVPVHQPLVAINQPLAMELDKNLADRAGQPLVHRKAFARPVAGRAEPPELAGNRAA